MVPSPQPPSPSPAGSALDAFRQATAVHHARIESLLGLGGPFGRAHYGVVLQGFGAFLDDWEERIAGVLPEALQGWFADGRRAALVHQDLQALGLCRAEAGVACTTGVATVPQALGSLYVMEGSALGGQLIAAGLHRRLGIGPDTGGAYFNGCGTGTAARWRSYRAIAETRLHGDAAAQADATEGAVGTFEALIATFQGLLDERAAA